MDLRGFLRALTRRWPSIALLAALGLGAGIAVTEISTPQYTAVSQIFVATRATTDVAEMNQGSAFSQARVQSYADIVGSPRVAAPVVRRLGLTTSGVRLAERISAKARFNTVLIDISVTDTKAVRAAQIANAVADEAGRLIVSLETPPGANAAPVHIGMTRSATPPAAPVSPRPVLYAGVGLLAGLLAGIALALLRYVLDTTMRTRDEFAEAIGVPVLGTVPFDRAAAEHPLVVGPGAHTPRAEAFRVIRTNLQFAQVDRAPRVILVTSSLPGEGKTNTAANLALSLSETGRRTCLVDADLRNPCVAKTFGLVRDVGLTTVLIGAAPASEVLQWHPGGALAVLASGAMPPNPAEILASDRMRQVLEDLTQEFDIVVVDSAPLLPVADTVGLASMVDGAVVVVRAGRTPSERAATAVASLRSVGTPILGGVLSMTHTRHQHGYGYGYGYGSTDSGSFEDLSVPPRPRHKRPTADPMGTGTAR